MSERKGDCEVNLVGLGNDSSVDFEAGQGSKLLTKLSNGIFANPTNYKTAI